MAYVISICGAGGKTTLLHSLANEYAKNNNSVAITTTTHIWDENSINSIDEVPSIIKGIIYCVGKVENEHNVGMNLTEYKKVCEKFDVVIIETDGSRGMPVKIPDTNREPVIPDNTNEIIVVFGLQSLGRKLKTVCQRFDEYKYRLNELNAKNVDENTLVTKELLEDFYNKFYFKFLKQKYNTKISLYLSDMTNNKNYEKYKNIKILYCNKNDLSSIEKQINILIQDLIKKYNHNINVDFELIEKIDLNLIKNNLDKYDLITIFQNDDNLENIDISKQIFYFICSNDKFSITCREKEVYYPIVLTREVIDYIDDDNLLYFLKKNMRFAYRYYV